MLWIRGGILPQPRRQLNLSSKIRQVSRQQSHFPGLPQAPLLPQVLLLLEIREGRWLLSNHNRVQELSLQIYHDSMPSRQPPHNFHNHYNPHNSIKQLSHHLPFSLKPTTILSHNLGRVTVHPHSPHLHKPKQPRAFKARLLLSTGEQLHLLPTHGRQAIPQHRTLP